MNCDPKALLAAAKCYQCVPKAVWGPTVISLLCEWSNNMAKCTFQSGAGSPVGVAVPKFIGQLYHDTVADTYYRSTGLTNADWVLIGTPASIVTWAPATEVATWVDGSGPRSGDLVSFQITADRLTVTQLDLSNKPITSLSNLQDLPSLSVLNCFSTSLTSLDVSNCTSLTTLACYSSSLTSIDVSGCTSLTTLNCYLNPGLTTITGITTCSALVALDCNTCDITGNLNLSGLSNLQNIVCYSNTNLTSITMTGCTALLSLDCNSCGITGILNVGGFSNLATLDCSYNSITGITLTGCVSLGSLRCFYNTLTSLDVSTFAFLSNCQCFRNSLTTLNVSGCTFLSNLLSSYNSLTNGAGGSVNIVITDMVTNNPPIGIIDVSYQTPAAPPDAGPPDGLTAKLTLVGLGWTVITD